MNEAVTICNLNAYDGHRSREFIEWILKNESNYALNFSNLLRYTDESNEDFKSYFEHYETIDSNFSIFYQGFLLDQMLITCQFDDEPCSPSDFYWFHDYDYGNCYTFNSGNSDQNGNGIHSHRYKSYKPRPSKKPGADNGLSIELYTGSTSNHCILIILLYFMNDSQKKLNEILILN